MSDAMDPPNLAWQEMQRSLARAVESASAGYPARQALQPHWKFTPLSGTWLDRISRRSANRTAR
jgi:hypothetical protein